MNGGNPLFPNRLQKSSWFGVLYALQHGSEDSLNNGLEPLPAGDYIFYDINIREVDYARL